MTRARKLVVFAAAFAAVLPVAALAQNEPATAEAPDDYDIQTGTRIQHVVVIGAMRDRRAPRQRAEQPADRRVPELPVTYEDAPAQPGK